MACNGGHGIGPEFAVLLGLYTFFNYTEHVVNDHGENDGGRAGRGQRAPNPGKAEFIRPLELSAQDRADIIAFLNSLTDRTVLSDPRWSDPW